MNNTQVNIDLEGLTIRFDKVIFLAAALVDSNALPGDLEDLLGDEQQAYLSELFGIPLTTLEDILGDTEGDTSVIADLLIDYYKFGFLVQVATPVRQYRADGSARISWGFCNTHWVYGETIAEAIELSKQWAVSRHQRDLDEFNESRQTTEGGAA